MFTLPPILKKLMHLLHFDNVQVRENYRAGAGYLRYFCIYSFSISDRENLREQNFIQIYLLLLCQSAILDPLFRIPDLWTLIWYIISNVRNS